MPILGKKTAVVMNPVWLFYIESTCVTLSSIGILYLSVNNIL